jgi:hypothetical protein
MVQIRLPPADSLCLAGFHPATLTSRAFRAGVRAVPAAR